MFANTPKPPYMAVIFTNTLTGNDPEGYALTAERMFELASGMEGYLGIESVKDSDGNGITVSYWRDEECIRHWKKVGEHQTAQAAGRKNWYKAYITRVARVERDYAFGLDN